MTDTMDQVDIGRLPRSGPGLWPRSRRDGRVLRAGDVPTGEEITFQSGLPLRTSGSVPVAPGWSPSTRRQLRLKRVLIDIPLATLALMMLSPLLVVVIALIRLTSRGPILFRQTRVGFGAKDFEILKFRTMHLD